MGSRSLEYGRLILEAESAGVLKAVQDQAAWLAPLQKLVFVVFSQVHVAGVLLLQAWLFALRLTVLNAFEF